MSNGSQLLNLKCKIFTLKKKIDFKKGLEKKDLQNSQYWNEYVSCQNECLYIFYVFMRISKQMDMKLRHSFYPKDGLETEQTFCICCSQNISTSWLKCQIFRIIYHIVKNQLISKPIFQIRLNAYQILCSFYKNISLFDSEFLAFETLKLLLLQP